jgi:hypothetical protein
MFAELDESTAGQRAPDNVTRVGWQDANGSILLNSTPDSILELIYVDSSLFMKAVRCVYMIFCVLFLFLLLVSLCLLTRLCVVFVLDCVITRIASLRVSCLDHER